jgi:S-adenosylmethionine/arginine decarboxylase-like enzyme
MTPIKHKHIIIRADVRQPPKTTEQVTEWLTKLIKTIDMKILEGPYAKRVDTQGNEGVTGMAIIETSHVVIHTWDSISPALIQLDVYSCKDFNPVLVLNSLHEFDPLAVDYKYFDRENNFKLLREEKYSATKTWDGESFK